MISVIKDYDTGQKNDKIGRKNSLDKRKLRTSQRLLLTLY